MPLEWNVRKRNVTAVFSGNRTFLVAIERVEGIMVKSGFIGAAEARGLFVGERRRA